MPSASDRDMLDLADMNNPLTVRYNLATSWGITSQELTCDVPELVDHIPETFAFFNRVWAEHIAFAMSGTCSLSFLELVRWKASPLPIVGASNGAHGLSSLPGTERDVSGALTLHTGRLDKWARRPFYIPNMHQTWQTDRVLNDAGTDGLYALAARLFMGLAGAGLGGPIAWFLAFPRVVDTTPANLVGVAFRKIEWIRVVNYCERCPDVVPLDWP